MFRTIQGELGPEGKLNTTAPTTAKFQGTKWRSEAGALWPPINEDRWKPKRLLEGSHGGEIL